MSEDGFDMQEKNLQDVWRQRSPTFSSFLEKASLGSDELSFSFGSVVPHNRSAWSQSECTVKIKKARHYFQEEFQNDDIFKDPGV